jgi:hypothetical protein
VLIVDRGDAADHVSEVVVLIRWMIDRVPAAARCAPLEGA